MTGSASAGPNHCLEVLEELKIIKSASGEVHNLGMGLGVIEGTEGQRVMERVCDEINLPKFIPLTVGHISRTEMYKMS
jgi:hypothetical protein